MGSYLGEAPNPALRGLSKKDDFTGDGSTTTFDLAVAIPNVTENDIVVFVENIRQEPGTGKAYTLGFDGSSSFKRITLTAAPVSGASIYVISGTETTRLLALADDAVNANKIADDAISEEHLDVTAITGNAELSAEAANDDVLLIYDTSASAIKKIQRSNLISVEQTDLVNDTSPQLGGMLDVNGQAIGDGTAELIKFSETGSAVNEVTVTNAATSNGPEISATGGDTNIDLKLTPKGSGKLNLDGIKFPNADGTADQILTTNGSGVLSFVDNSGGTSWVAAVKTANFTAAAGEGYFVNTSGGAFEIDLPGSPSVGDFIEFVDFSRSFGTNKLTLDQGSLKFQGNTSPKPEYNTDGQNIQIVYSGSTQGWIPVRDDDVTMETPQNYTIDYLVIGGGGGGGSGSNSAYIRTGGGGGAGGYRATYNSEASGGGGSSETQLTVTAGITLTADIGAGGAGSTSAGDNGTIGEDTTLTGTGVSITSAGGGRGGADSVNGQAGGSGGGGGAVNGNTSGGAGTSNQGYAGAGGQGNIGGAGGGAGEAGGTDDGPSGYTDKLTAGGDGVASTITGSSVVRAGGGSAASSTTVTPGSDGGGGSGGSGGGGSTGTAGGNGTANTGSGGGSSGENNGSAGNGGTGGSGVVILRMATASYTGTTTGSPTVTTSGSDTIITFNGDGSYTT